MAETPQPSHDLPLYCLAVGERGGLMVSCGVVVRGYSFVATKRNSDQTITSGQDMLA